MGEDPTRRRFLRASGVGVAAGIAGCNALEVGDRGGPSGDTGQGGDVFGDGRPQWPMFQFDAAHSGHPPSATGPQDSVTERWAVLSDVRIDAAPAVAADTLFVGGGEHLYAIDAAEGEVHWRVLTDGQVTSTPAVGDRIVYIPGATSVYAIDGRGAVQWQHTIGSRIVTDPVVTQSGILVASDAVLRALDTTGDTRWEFEQSFDEPPEARSLTTPAVSSDGTTVYVGGNFEYGEKPQFRHGRMYALDPQDGTRLWGVEFDDNVSSPTAGDERIYFGTRYGTMEALATDTGRREWSLEIGGDVVSSPALVDGTIYFGADAIYAVDAASGEVQWQFDLPEETFWSSSSPAVADGVVYIGSGVLGREGRIYALDAEDGTERWHREFDAPVFTSPAVVDGTLYVGNDRLRSITGTE